MPDVTRKAVCLCGALIVTTNGEPAHVLMCSCTDCRRKSGSAFSVSTYWPEAQTEITGATKQFRRATRSGRALEYHFCPDCGVAVFWRADFAPDTIGIGAGNFADSAFAVPSKSYWTEQRPDWLENLADIPTIAQQ